MTNSHVLFHEVPRADLRTSCARACARTCARTCTPDTVRHRRAATARCARRTRRGAQRGSRRPVPFASALSIKRAWHLARKTIGDPSHSSWPAPTVGQHRVSLEGTRLAATQASSEAPYMCIPQHQYWCRGGAKSPCTAPTPNTSGAGTCTESNVCPQRCSWTSRRLKRNSVLSSSGEGPPSMCRFGYTRCTRLACSGAERQRPPPPRARPVLRGGEGRGGGMTGMLMTLASWKHARRGGQRGLPATGPA